MIKDSLNCLYLTHPGWYISVESKQSDQVSPAALQSPTMTQASTTCTLHFYYNMYGEGMFHLHTCIKQITFTSVIRVYFLHAVFHSVHCFNHRRAQCAAEGKLQVHNSVVAVWQPRRPMAIRCGNAQWNTSGLHCPLWSLQELQQSRTHRCRWHSFHKLHPPRWEYLC